MSRWRRFLANPYKAQTVYALLTRSLRRRLVRSRLKSLTPATLSQVLGISGKVAEYFQKRQNPAFFFAPERISRIVAAIPVPQKEATVKQAYQQTICRMFSYRGSNPVSFPEDIDWRCAADNDPDWNRDLHRLDWLVTALLASHYTGDKNYAAAAGETLCHWWQDNPPGTKPWQDIFEVAQRAQTLSWIFFLGLRLPAFSSSALEMALLAILASGIWLETNLEYQTPNNHLLIEIIRLFELGLLFPEYPATWQWRQLGLALLAKEVDRQVLPDGFHCELSVFYHRLVLEALLEIIALAHRNSLELPEIIRQRVGNMLDTLQLVRRPDGTYALWGDGFQSDILLRHDLLAAGALVIGRGYPGGEVSARTLWLLNGTWPQPSPASLPATHFWSDAGYAVMTRPQSEGLHQLMFDCGPFGLVAAPGHGHADCLSVTLNFGPQPILIDPGTYSFRDLSWRRAFRGTAAHNTIIVENQEQTPIPGFFGAGRFARARVDNAIFSDGVRFFDASHDGYTRLSHPVWHRRLLLDLPDTGWLMIDLLTGHGKHPVTLNWHFHQEVKVVITDSQLDGFVNGSKLFQMHCYASSDMMMKLIRGQEDPPLGWLSEEAGIKVAAPILRISGEIEMPLCIATLCVPTTGDMDSSLQLQRTTAGYALEVKNSLNSTIVLLSLGKPVLLNLAPWLVSGTLFLCHQTSSTRDLILAGGNAITHDQVKIFSLPRSSRGVLFSQRPDHFRLAGEVELPLEISCPRELPVLVNEIPATVVFDRQKQLLRVLK
jgi:hypothetical protein